MCVHVRPQLAKGALAAIICAQALADCLADQPEWRGLLRIKELELGGPIEWTAPQSGPG